MKLPPRRSDRSPTASAAAAATSPVQNVTSPVTTTLASSTCPRRGVAASVVLIRPRRYSAVINMAPTTTATISPTNVPSSATEMLTPYRHRCPVCRERYRRTR